MRRPALVAAVALGGVAAPGAALAASTAYSTNWSGYVVHAQDTKYRTVSGSWTQPSATCTAGRETYSAIWVGLGGYRENAKALEQVGTDADCSRAGRPSYTSWFELVPASAVELRLSVHPGDEMGASVTVIGRDVTLRLRDDTTGGSVVLTRRLTSIDVSSAEWVVEAPSYCSGSRCETLALTDFGNVAFASATAATGARAGTIGDRRWRSVRLILRQSALGSRSGAAGAASASLVTSTPGAAGAGGAFAVAFGESAGSAESTAPTLPGFSGGGSGPP